MRVNAVVVAAGEGKRMGGDLPKALIALAGRPLILHTLDRFARSQVRKVILVAPGKQRQEFEQLIATERPFSRLECVLESGGPRRQDSVRRGLNRLDDDCEVVVIHDGARPLVTPAIIDRCVELALKEGAAVVGVPAKDTIKVVSASRRIESTPPRNSLWEIQTPQAFRVEIVREAHRRAEQDGIEATDDAMLVERLGKSVALLEGERSNLKVTTADDLLIAEALIGAGRV
ncbi:MAG: 2-C-methyl-D-erythritol 4-phosphate cytidylyltransferase [Candidatus Binatia bacterium]